MRYFLIIILLFTACGSKSHDISKLSNYDCGSISNPYTLAESYFKLDDVVYLRINFVHFVIRDSVPNHVPEHDWDQVLDYLNAKIHPTKVQFVTNFVGYNFLDDSTQIVDYKKYFLLLENEYASKGIDPAITAMVFPDNFNFWPGAAVSIPARGFVIQDSYLTTNTFIHEILHCLGLEHTHTPDPTKGDTYSTGDKICDIMYHPPMLRGTKNCTWIVDLQRDLSEQEQKDLVTNYMSYSDRICRENISPVQIDRIRKTIEVTPALLETIAFPNILDETEITTSDKENFQLYEF